MHMAGRMVAVVAGVILCGGALFLWLGASDGSAASGPAVAEGRVAGEVGISPGIQDEIAVDEAETPRPKTREEKRFARADRDDNGLISEEEYLHNRRRNFDRLDVDGDGRLSFREYARSGIDKFAGADANGDGVLDAEEFATLAPKPRATPARAKNCPPCARETEEGESD